MNARLVSAKELAARYSLAPKTIRKWARCNILPVVKFNCRCIRFDVEACDAVVNKRTRIAGFSTIKTTCAIALLSGVLLPILLAFLATKWQPEFHQRETIAFVNGLRRQKTGSILALFQELKNRLFNALTRFANVGALALEVA